MAQVPPWLNVSPSDFLRAMQAGATAGLQVADLRQRGSLEADRLAQSAAIAAANRSAAAQAQANSLAFQEWERGELGRQAAEANARQERVAMAGLEQRGLEAGLERQLEMARDLETGRHHRASEERWRELDKAQADKIKAQLNLPTKLHINVVGGNLIATDPTTGQHRILFSAPEKPSRPGSTRISGLPVNAEFPEEFGTVSGPLTDPFILQRLGTNAPSGMGIPGSLPAPQKSGVKRYTFNPETGRIEPKE